MAEVIYADVSFRIVYQPELQRYVIERYLGVNALGEEVWYQPTGEDRLAADAAELVVKLATQNREFRTRLEAWEDDLQLERDAYHTEIQNCTTAVATLSIKVQELEKALATKEESNAESGPIGSE